MGYIKFKYYQKSLLFLYPLIGISKLVSIHPTNTYLYWNGHDGIENYELFVHYKYPRDEIFKNFEKEHILKNTKLIGCHEVDDGMIYIFDLIYWSTDIASFLYGRYSEFTYKAKETILKFNGASVVSNKKVEGYTIHIALCPQYYFKDYAEELGYINKKTRQTDSTFLEECGELWSIYDKEKETFIQETSTVIQCCEEKIIII